MKFSIILATRNRPAMFRVALDSVLAQRDIQIELIILNDGSDEIHLDGYRAIEAELGDRATCIYLPRTMNGHGQSYVLNFGAARATGDYIGFLDDDDLWTDDGHLARAGEILSAQPQPPDLYFTCQHAYFQDELRTGEIWLDGLERRLPVPDQAYYTVTVEDLLKATGFAHVNNTLIRREHFAAIRGFDETIRYECDRDFYLRAVDGAGSMVYAPVFISRHNIPDPARGDNMSTAMGQIDRHIFQLRVLDKAICFSTHASLRAYARRHKAYTLQRLAAAVSQAGRPREAFYYAREAMLLRPSPSALALAFRLGVKRKSAV